MKNTGCGTPDSSIGMGGATPECDALKAELHRKFPDIAQLQNKLLYYMEAAESFGQLARDLEMRRSASAGWISVNDRLPAEDQNVLAFGTDSDEPVIAFLLNGFWCYSESPGTRVDVQQWQPLPQPPVSDSRSDVTGKV